MNEVTFCITETFRPLHNLVFLDGFLSFSSTDLGIWNCELIKVITVPNFLDISKKKINDIFPA